MTEETLSPEELAERFKEESMKHRENKKQERKRHKQKVQNLIEKGRIVEIRKKHKENRDISNEIHNNRKEFKQKFFNIIHTLTGSKSTRICVNSMIKIRDDSVYRYGESNIADFSDIINYQKVINGICDNISSSESQELLKKSIEELEKNEINKRITKRKTLTEGDDYYIIYNLMIDLISIYEKEKYTYREILKEKSKSRYKRDTVNIDTTKSKNLIQIAYARDDIEKSMSESKEKLKDIKQKEKELFEKIIQRFNKEVVLNGLD